MRFNITDNKTIAVKGTAIITTNNHKGKRKKSDALRPISVDIEKLRR